VTGEFQLENFQINGIGGIAGREYYVTAYVDNSMQARRSTTYTLPTSTHAYATLSHITGMADSVWFTIKPVSAVGRPFQPSFLQIGYSPQGVQDTK
jgi:hypothetical protein